MVSLILGAPKSTAVPLIVLLLLLLAVDSGRVGRRLLLLVPHACAAAVCPASATYHRRRMTAASHATIQGRWRQKRLLCCLSEALPDGAFSNCVWLLPFEELRTSGKCVANAFPPVDRGSPGTQIKTKPQSFPTFYVLLYTMTT